jgi:hypothetical protein
MTDKTRLATVTYEAFREMAKDPSLNKYERFIPRPAPAPVAST